MILFGGFDRRSLSRLKSLCHCVRPFHVSASTRLHTLKQERDPTMSNDIVVLFQDLS